MGKARSVMDGAGNRQFKEKSLREIYRLLRT
jgi:hypothetical protein